MIVRRALTAAVLALAACRPQPPPAPSVRPLPSRLHDADAQGFYLQPAGLADDFPEESASAEKIARDLDAARAAGARYFRFAMGWDGVDSAPGVRDFHLWDAVIRAARERGIAPLPYVCYTPRWLNDDPKDYWRKPPRDLSRFAEFVEAAARRYRGRVPSWELWNEPDNDFYWLGTVDEFAEMIRLGAAAVRRGDPQAKVVLGGMSKGRSPFLEHLMVDRRIGDVVDVISIHGYLETWDARRAEDYPAFITAAAELVRETAPRDDVWMAEFGYADWRRPDGRPSEWSYAVKPFEHTAGFQAIALLRAHALALGTSVLSLTTWYRVDDLPAGENVIGDDNNKHLGILDVQGRPKPAFAALRLWNQLLDAPVRAIDVRADGSPDAVVRAFEKRSGEVIVLAWLRSAREHEHVPDAGTIALRLPRTFGSAESLDPRTGASTSEDPALRSVQVRADSVRILRLR